MKAVLLKIVRNPGVQKAFMALVLALAAAVGLSFTGCTPSQIQTAKDARSVADCVNGVLKDVPLDALSELSVDEAEAFAKRVEACSKVRAE